MPGRWPLKLAVLMSRNSPWSREAVIRLAALGHQIHLLEVCLLDRHTYLNVDDPSQAKDIEEFERSIFVTKRIKPWPVSNVRYVAASWALHRILKNQRCDLLLTLYGGGFATMAYLSGFRPYVVYVVGSDVLLGGPVKKSFSRYFFNAASAVMANGKYLAERTRELAPKASVQCLYLGTDTMKFTPASSRSRPVKIVCTRGFSEIYNNEYLIHALREIPPSTEVFRLTFAAPGPLLNKVREVADQILSPAIRSSIEFLGGVGRDRMAELLRDADIYASVSRSDGTSLSLMEGLACGLFPVVSDIPANREWVSNESKNGILVPLDEPKTLAAALVRAICDRELCAKAGAYNRELILQHADSRRTMAILGHRLEQIASTHRSSMHST
jgi:glycosyltransferase involved in cell wall biosynthesis